MMCLHLVERISIMLFGREDHGSGRDEEDVTAGCWKRAVEAKVIQVGSVR
jgi:hypothetical protein